MLSKRNTVAALISNLENLLSLGYTEISYFSHNDECESTYLNITRVYDDGIYCVIETESPLEHMSEPTKHTFYEASYKTSKLLDELHTMDPGLPVAFYSDDIFDTEGWIAADFFTDDNHPNCLTAYDISDELA